MLDYDYDVIGWSGKCETPGRSTICTLITRNGEADFCLGVVTRLWTGIPDTAEFDSWMEVGFSHSSFVTFILCKLTITLY